MKLKGLINSVLKCLSFNSAMFLVAFTFNITSQALAQPDTIPNKHKYKIGVGIILPVYDFNSTIISPGNWPREFIDKPFYNVIVPRDSTNAHVKQIPFFTLNFKAGHYIHTIGYKSKTINLIQENNTQNAIIKSELIGYSVYRLFGEKKIQPYIGLGVNYYKKNWVQFKAYQFPLNYNYFLYESLDTKMFSFQIPFGFQYTILKNFGLVAEMGVNAYNFGYSNSFFSRRPNYIRKQENFKYQKISFSAISFKFNYLIGVKIGNRAKQNSKIVKFNSYLAKLKESKFLDELKLGLGLIIPIYDFNNILLSPSKEPTNYVEKPFYNVVVPLKSNKSLVSNIPFITINFQYRQYILTFGLKSKTILENLDPKIDRTNIKSTLYTYRCYKLFGKKKIQPFVGLGMNYLIKSWQQPSRRYIKENSGFIWYIDEHSGLDSKIYSMQIPFGLQISFSKNLSLSIESSFNTINHIKYSTYYKKYPNPTVINNESKFIKPSISAISFKVNYMLDFKTQSSSNDQSQLKNEQNSKFIEIFKKLGINVGLSAGINSYGGKYLSYFMFNHIPFNNYYNNVERYANFSGIAKSYYMQQQKKLCYNIDYFISFKNKISFFISSKRLLDETVKYNGIDISGKTQRHTLSAQYYLLSYNWNYKILQFYAGIRLDKYLYNFKGSYNMVNGPSYPFVINETYQTHAQFLCFQSIAGIRIFALKNIFFDLGSFFNVYSYAVSNFKYEQKDTYDYLGHIELKDYLLHTGTLKKHIYFNSIDKISRNYLGLCIKMGFRI